MKELTDSLPKPMLMVAGKTLIEHKLDALPPEIDEVVIVVGYFGGVVHDRFGGEYRGKKLFYVEQDVLDGTAGALWRTKDILKDRFIVFNGDDIYAESDIAQVAATPDWSMLLKELDHVRSGRIVSSGGSIIAIEEGDVEGGHGFTNTGLYGLDTRIFNFPMVPKAEGNSEFGLPQTMLAASKASGIPITAVSASTWMQLTSPEDISAAETLLARA